jgi:hypothetical protein
MFGYFLEHFKVELLVFTICAAVSVGMVVQRLPQAAIPPTRTTTSTTTTTPAQKPFLEIVSECNAAMNQLRTWVVDNGKTFTDAQWQEANQRHTQWGTYCTQNAPGWQMPYGMNALRYSIQSQQASSDLTLTTCEQKMAQFRNYVSEVNETSRRARPLGDSAWQLAVARTRELEQTQRECHQRVRGWKVPFTVTMDTTDRLLLLTFHQ